MSADTTWNGYRIRLRLASPLHIGWRTVGNLKLTRRYVPGRAIWGALACRLARDCYNRDYQKAGKEVHENTRYTYLFVSDCAETVSVFPWEDEEEFSWRYLHSYTSTAQTEKKSKLDGSLHETEFIGARSRNGGAPVWLHGYIWVKGSADKILESLRSLQIGGERSYGWGRMAEVFWVHLNSEDTLFGTFGWKLDDDALTLEAAATAEPHCHSVLAHVVGSEGNPLQGRVEALLGRTTEPTVGEEQFGRVISPASICFAPGAVALAPAVYRVQRFGLWDVPANPSVTSPA